MSEFLAIRRHIIDVSTTFRRYQQLSAACVNKNNNLNQVLRLSQFLLENPEDDSAFIRAMFRISSVRALGHLDVVCNRQGGGLLRHRWLVYKTKHLAPKRSMKRVDDIPFAGVLLERWNPAAFGAACDADLVENLTKYDDPLAKYFKAFRGEITKCPFVIIGRLARSVARDCCYARPECAWFKTCALYSDRGTTTGRSDQYPWRKRIVVVDLLFTQGPSAVDKACMMLVQTVSLLRNQRVEQEALEADIMHGLPRLSIEEQGHHLRRLFYRYRAINNAQQKGSLFERLALGLLSLVPGWVPVGTNLDTLGNELDLTIRVEASTPGALYWRDIVGTGIIVECKNHPAGLRVPEAVAKLRANMTASGAQLGLLLNTGPIDRRLRVEASRDPRSRLCVVLLDGNDIEHMTMNPGDIETFVKARVHMAQMGIIQLPAGQRPGRARRKREKTVPPRLKGKRKWRP